MDHRTVYRSLGRDVLVIHRGARNVGFIGVSEKLVPHVLRSFLTAAAAVCVDMGSRT